jgi:hypothetical protein
MHIPSYSHILHNSVIGKLITTALTSNYLNNFPLDNWICFFMISCEIIKIKISVKIICILISIDKEYLVLYFLLNISNNYFLHKVHWYITILKFSHIIQKIPVLKFCTIYKIYFNYLSHYFGKL